MEACGTISGMGFSVVSWNIRRFGSRKKNETNAKYKARVKAHTSRVAAELQRLEPDVFGLFEVEGADVMGMLDNHFPGYDFFITDGPQTMEILVAARRSAFEQVSFVQKRGFREAPRLRPGALLTVKRDGKRTSLLFLHTDSGRGASDFGNRDDNVRKIWNLRRALSKNVYGNARFVAMGDLNTMGMAYPTDRRGDERIAADLEIEAIAGAAAANGMRMVSKDADLTYQSPGGSLRSNLDHVIASDEVPVPGGVEVYGWVELPKAKQKAWINKYSDHCALRFDVG